MTPPRRPWLLTPALFMSTRFMPALCMPALCMPALCMPALCMLATCSPAPQTAANRADQATLAACRQRAEDVYVQQNRDLLYAPDTSSTPYSAGPNTGIPTHGLSTLFAQQRTVDDCVRNTGTQIQRTDSVVTPPPSVAAAPALPAGSGGSGGFGGPPTDPGPPP
jgi:hypothetical protein